MTTTEKLNFEEKYKSVIVAKIINIEIGNWYLTDGNGQWHSFKALIMKIN